MMLLRSMLFLLVTSLAQVPLQAQTSLGSLRLNGGGATVAGTARVEAGYYYSSYYYYVHANASGETFATDSALAHLYFDNYFESAPDSFAEATESILGYAKVPTSEYYVTYVPQASASVIDQTIVSAKAPFYATAGNAGISATGKSDFLVYGNPSTPGNYDYDLFQGYIDVIATGIEGTTGGGYAGATTSFFARSGRLVVRTVDNDLISVEIGGTQVGTITTPLGGEANFVISINDPFFKTTSNVSASVSSYGYYDPFLYPYSTFYSTYSSVAPYSGIDTAGSTAGISASSWFKVNRFLTRLSSPATYSVNYHTDDKRTQGP